MFFFALTLLGTLMLVCLKRTKRLRQTKIEEFYKSQ